jgi:hypothetical protein
MRRSTPDILSGCRGAEKTQIGVACSDANRNLRQRVAKPLQRELEAERGLLDFLWKARPGAVWKKFALLSALTRSDNSEGTQGKIRIACTVVPWFIQQSTPDDK